MKKNRTLTNRIMLVTGILFGFALLFSGCDNFSFYSELDGADNIRINPPPVPTEELVITPASAIIPVNMNYTFSASGGVPPYTFSVAAGEGTIDPASGIFTSPAAPGSSEVQVTDSEGTARGADVVTIMPGEFTISPRSITIYTHNTAVFSAIGGIAPFTFSIVSGGGTINAETGIYTAPGTPGTATVRVTGAQNNTSDAEVVILAPFRLSPTAVSVTVNNTYTFSASGGKTPYFFEVTSGSSTINSATGQFTAHPTTPETATVQATDALGNTQAATVYVIPAAPLAISPSSATVVENGTVTFSATGGSGSYTFTIFSGIGNITSPGGIYSAPLTGTGSAIVRLSDGVTTRDAAVTVVASGPLTISPATGATVEQNTVLYFTAGGGTPPYTYEVTAGGGYINAATGVYTAPVTLGSATIKVSDSVGGTASSTVDIAPAVPTSVYAEGTPATPTDIILHWTDNAVGEDGFAIEWKILDVDNYSDHLPPILVGPNINSYNHTALTPNNLYVYRIRAYKGTVYSAYSAEGFNLPN